MTNLNVSVNNNWARLLYSNCQKKKSATHLMCINADIDNNIIAITEPWLGKKCRASFRAPWRVHCMGIDSRAILVTPPWANAFVLNDLSDKDSVFCWVTIGDSTFIIGVMYAEGGFLDTTSWSNKFNELIKICPRILIVADSNAHSKLWGYNRSDKKGETGRRFFLLVV